VRLVRLAATLLLAPVLACAPGPAPGARPPHHLVLISVDTLRADHLACYGHPFVESPCIDRLAREGVLFERNTSAASSTLASHTSMMTGTYPATHGARANTFTVAAENVLLAEHLAARGFETAGFIGGAPLDPRSGFAQGFAHYDASYTEKVGDSPVGSVQRRAGDVVSATLAWLADGWRGGRLFLFVHLFDVHAPYDAPAPFAGMYRRAGWPSTAGTMKELEEARRALRGGLSSMGDDGFRARVLREVPDGARTIAALDAAYSAEITYVDSELARLRVGLEELGILPESLLVLTADHGETMAEHAGLLNHGEDVFETEVHTPLILRFADGRFAGTRCQVPISGVDLAPTLLEFLGLPAPAGVEGASFAPFLTGRVAAPPRDHVFSEATKPPHPSRTRREAAILDRPHFRSVSDARYKLVWRGADLRRVFDLADDPDEQENLLRHDRAVDEERVERLLSLLRAHLAGEPTGQAAPVSAEQARALEALGY